MPGSSALAAAAFTICRLQWQKKFHLSSAICNIIWELEGSNGLYDHKIGLTKFSATNLGLT